MYRPKHGYCQHGCDNQCERNIEILAHVNRLKALGSEHKEKLTFGRLSVKTKEAQHQGLGGSDKLKFWAGKCIFWAGKCIYRDNRRDFPTLLIPTSDIFYAQNFAQILAIFKASQLQ